MIRWSGYDINHFCFYTKLQDNKSTVQNSGVMIVAEAMHFSSSKDKHPVMASLPYYRVIEDIWEVDYIKFRVPVFKCNWVDSNSGIKINELGFTLVNLSKLSYTDEPFIMATQAKQVFYVTDPANNNWSVVLQGKQMSGNDDLDDSDIQLAEITSCSSNKHNSNDENEVDDVYAIQHDHEEGIWENN